MTTAPTNCLTCSEWLRTDDPCVGLCQAFAEWRGQFEGYDRELGACQRYAFGEAREKSAYTELPKPKPAPRNTYKKIVEQNMELIREWRQGGRSYSWMAHKLEIPVRNSSCIGRYFKSQEAVNE